VVLIVEYHKGPQCLGYKLKKKQNNKITIRIFNIKACFICPEYDKYYLDFQQSPINNNNIWKT
jgi:hypothetical protein